MHFSEVDIQLFFFLFDMLFPFEPRVKCYTQIFGCICIWNFLRVNFNRNPVNFTIFKIYVSRFRFIKFDSPSLCPTALTALCSLLVDSSMLSPVAIIAVSSANVILASFDFGMSLVYSRNKTGPRTLPCGIPAVIFFMSEYSPSCLTRKCLSAI